MRPTSALTSDQRHLLRRYLDMTRSTRRTVATWHPTTVGDHQVVRVTFTTWGRRDVYDQYGTTVRGLREAWHLVAATLNLPPHVASDRQAFRGWAQLARR